MSSLSARFTQFAQQRRRGSLLLLSVVILGFIVISAVFLSLLFLNEIKSTRFSDNALISYYVAESGAEDALWRLKYARESGDEAFFDDLLGMTLCGAETGATETGCLSDDSGSDLERLVDFGTVTRSADDFTATNIPVNRPVFVDLFDPAQEYQVGADIGVTQFNINWYFGECDSGHASSELEITWTPIDAETLTLGTPFTDVDVCDCIVGGPPDSTTGLHWCGEAELPLPQYSAQYGGLSSDDFYRISFRPRDQDVSLLVMTTDSNVPSQVDVTATGIYRESESVVTLRTNWRDALTGIFNYIVFSEDSLIKAVQGTQSSAFGSLCGLCTDGVTGCSSDIDCVSAGGTCDAAQAPPLAFCAPETNANEDGLPPGFLQTNHGNCNDLCNGLTLCGDGIQHSPNGAGVDGTDNTPDFDPMVDAGTGYEMCDDGNFNNNVDPNACRTNCLLAYCGDGVVDAGDPWNIAETEEYCDDGNAWGFDECDTTGSNPESAGACTLTFCGDGTVQAPNGSGQNEQCDPGGSFSCALGGCSSACQSC